MIEISTPEINPDIIINKIREKIAKSLDNSRNMHQNSDPDKMIQFIHYIEALLRNAESRAYIRTKLPSKVNRFPLNFNPKISKLILKLFNFLFKDQREVNLNLITALKESVALNKKLINQIIDLNTQITDLNTQIYEQFSNVDSRFQVLDQRLNDTSISIQGIDENINIKDSSINNCLTDIQKRLGNVNSTLQGIDEHLVAVDEHLVTADNRVQEIDERYMKNDSYLKNDLIQQKRLITMFLEEAQKRLTEPFTQDQLHSFAKEKQHTLDAFYVAFEDQFRGSRVDILNRLKVYLPLIEEADIGKPDSPILDVGCGRGEWLELLRESGHTARGLDINRVMLEQCRARGLEVLEADVISYLQSLPDASLGAVTGFHIIEHLPFEVLLKLFNEATRVLKTGGLIIFETPNPDNVLVGSNTFYLDPTHRNPLPSSMIKFVAESFGLSRVSCIKLHDTAESRLTGSEVAERFSDYFYGPQDYAVVGFKP
ncbi:methyltransferase domain-containing protein [Nostoc sp. CENA67]|uniref:Methyltransferase domain-containing protein n=1 Tax=Amazonocrinis nigriterrae CENA67 TaxID=2794033 RepID=A0A8J7LCW2_9NOST|nr:class I SAM-dependent methyltransferase [Amazonocrinis nigriterrae]MBH8566851.1 methyltransferase domain-containing protein [Amazonocrinis nigriterrae CENA67]